jgi:RNA polymerase sigma-70 factor, ECF subfamily
VGNQRRRATCNHPVSEAASTTTLSGPAGHARGAVIGADSDQRRHRLAELDELTIARAQRGDTKAKRALVERYQRPVIALVSRLLRGRCDSGLVEDIAQETFLRVFRALPRFDRNGPARLSTWILTIASHRSIDELRRRRLDTRPIEVGGPDLQSSDRADEAAERKVLASLIQNAVETLTPEYQAAFILREYHGLEYTEIAQALEIDLGTVKSRLNRARRRLREALLEVYHA